MKNILKISAFVSLFLMISIAGFSQGRTCAMKFRPATTSIQPYYAVFYLVDTSTSSILDQSPVIQVYDNIENDNTFSSYAPSSTTPIYKYYVYVWDSNGHSGGGWSVSFNAPAYFGDEIPVDIIDLQ